LTPFLEGQGVVILDGGLASDLESRGCDLSDDLWSARILLEQPELLRQAHHGYLAAGADCIATASYQATYEGFAARGLDEAEATTVLVRSVEIACEARDEFWSQTANREGRLRPLVAASIGPYGAFLADGSEYRGAYDLDETGLLEFHRRRLQVLASGRADLVAFETIPSAVEALALRRLVDATPGLGAWISFSCRDGAHLSDGSGLEEVVSQIQDCPGFLAMGVNCIAPELVAPLISTLRSATAKPITVYPNSGEDWDAEARSWKGNVTGNSKGEPGELDSLSRQARQWIALGAQLVGGCCRTGPEDIRHLRKTLLS
jgi:homocysteine S-methyltransferase